MPETRADEGIAPAQGSGRTWTRKKAVAPGVDSGGNVTGPSAVPVPVTFRATISQVASGANDCACHREYSRRGCAGVRVSWFPSGPG